MAYIYIYVEIYMRKSSCIQTIFHTKTIQHRKNWFRDPYLATRGIDLHDFYIYQNKRGNVIESVVIFQLHYFDNY